jgi:hypothetical protein
MNNLFNLIFIGIVEGNVNVLMENIKNIIEKHESPDASFMIGHLQAVDEVALVI